MKTRKIIFGIALIVLAFSTLFMSIIPSIYAQNKAGKIDKEVDVNFSFLKKEKSPYVLLYFGYVGCTTVCGPSLEEINEIYKNLDNKKFSFYFINLLENTQKQNVELFAKSFNEKFKGVYLEKKELKSVIETLRVKVLPSLVDKYELDHSSFLYVLKKHKDAYKQISIYTARPFKKQIIINDLKNI